MMELETVLSREVLQILDRMDLSVGMVHRGRPGGPHPSSSLGQGTRFEDFRRYSPGDDLRYLDWNVLGRLGEPFIKQYAREEAGRLTLLLDRTASMVVSPGVEHTLRSVAAILAYLGLKSGYHVEGIPVPEPGPWEDISPAVFRGRGAAGEVFQWLERLPFGVAGPLFEAVRGAVGGRALGAATYLLSDMADPEAGDRIFRFLRSRRCRPALVQVVPPMDRALERSGHLEMVDPESGRVLRLRLTPKLRRRYWKRLARFHEQVRLRCRALGVRHVRLESGLAPDRNMVQCLRKGGLLQ